MMRAKRFLLLAILIFGICCGISAKTLVAYYSFTNNVRTIVNELAAQKEVDILEIQPAAEGLDYAANNYALGTQLLNAIKAAPNDADSYPAIKAVSVDLNEYDDVIVATPLWWNQMAAPMQTFLFNYGAQMAGKRVSLIVSSASSGISQVVNDAKRLIPDAIWTGDALWINNKNRTNTASLLSEWLKTWGDKRIVVISDTHVMAPELLVSEGEAWTNYISGHQKMLDYSQPLFDEMVTKIKDEIKPDLVLITGDLTKDGEQLSHTYVVSKLDELREAGIQTLVIPGNHDRGANAGAVSFDGANTTAVAVADDDWFATQYANYGYGTSSERESTSLTYACEPIEGLVVIGIDSGTEGSLSSATLEWIVGKALAAKESGKKVIAMMHHPLIPHVTNAGALVPTYVVNDHDNIRKALTDAGIKVIFTGHFHTSDIAKDFNDELTDELYDVNTGSLISYPCDYREVTISGDLSELSLTIGHITSLPDDDTFSSEYAMSRLHDSVKRTIKGIIDAKLGAAAAYLSSAIEAMADNVADAFVIHAEGNEAEVDTEELMSTLSLAFTYMPETEAMCKSMLEDKAPYGEEGRENVTDDLSLNVKMADKYKLKYQIGDEVVKTVELVYGSKILQTWTYVAPSKEGYTFSSWSEIPETMPAHDVTITGSYTANKYKLVYQVDGEAYKSLEVSYGSTVTPEEDPSQEGYTFSGWSEIPETMPAHDVTITGSYTANKYKLVYQVDGEAYKSLEISFGSTVTPEEDPSQEGYTFSGWSEIPETMPAHDVTITGSYTANKYKLVYQVDGETFKSLEVSYGSTVTPEEEPSQEGYTFSGWSEIPETMPAHDVTITGSYTANKYKLVYQVDGETFKSLEVSYGSTVTPEEEPSQEGYTFSGWSEIPKTMPAHDVTITGRFFLLGDANGDGVVNVTDIVEIINFMNMKASAEFNKKAADVTGEGDVDENDINAISSLIMSEN